MEEIENGFSSLIHYPMSNWSKAFRKIYKKVDCIKKVLLCLIVSLTFLVFGSITHKMSRREGTKEGV